MKVHPEGNYLMSCLFSEEDCEKANTNNYFGTCDSP